MGVVKGIGKAVAETNVTVNRLATIPEMLAYMTSKIPKGRLGTVEEVATIACWICSPEASLNIGYVFDLSGGRATF